METMDKTEQEIAPPRHPRKQARKIQKAQARKVKAHLSSISDHLPAIRLSLVTLDTAAVSMSFFLYTLLMT